MTTEPEQSSGLDARTLERHFQSIALTILAAVTGWFGMTVQDSTVKLATMAERLSNLERQLNTNSELLYTARDAAKDWQLRDAMLNNLTNRITDLEAQLRRK